MKHIFIIPVLALLFSCQSLPQLFQTAEEIADDTAIRIEVSRETIKMKKDVSVVVDVKNNKPNTN